MMKIRKICLPNGRRQWCLTKGSRKNINLVCKADLRAQSFSSSSSEIFVDEESKLFLKAPPLKSFWIDNLTKLVGWTPADREVRGNLILQKLSIPTIPVLVGAIPMNPFNPYRSLLYSHFLGSVVPLDEYLQHNPESPDRQKIIDTVATHLSTMFRNGVYFRDFYFGNLLYSSTGDLYWIDTEVQYYRLRKSKPLEKFLQKKQYMYERFLRGGGKTNEWDRFLHVLIEAN